MHLKNSIHLSPPCSPPGNGFLSPDHSAPSTVQLSGLEMLNQALLRAEMWSWFLQQGCRNGLCPCKPLRSQKRFQLQPKPIQAARALSPIEPQNRREKALPCVSSPLEQPDVLCLSVICREWGTG